MIKRLFWGKILVSTIAFLMAMGLVSSVEAQNSPKGIKTEIKNLKAVNQQVTGELTLSNLSDVNYRQLYYNLTLNSPSIKSDTVNRSGQSVTILSKGPTVSTEDSEISLASGASQTIPVQLNYNDRFQEGTYSVIASVKTIDGVQLGYSTASLNIATSNSGVLIDPLTCDVVVNGKAYRNADGPLISAQDQAFFKCTVVALDSTSTQPLTAKYAIDYAVRFVNNNPGADIKTFNGPNTVTINRTNPTVVQFEIPRLTEPQVYEGQLYLMDQANQKISPSIPFRWIVPGASSFIESISLDKPSYQKGQEMTISVTPHSSMDLYWRNELLNTPEATTAGQVGTELENAMISVQVSSGSGASCGSKTVPLPSTKQVANWGVQEVKITAEQDCPDPIVKVDVIYNDQVLASLTKKVDLPVPQTAGFSWQNPWVRNALLGLMGLVLAGGAVAFWLWKRRKKTPPSAPMASNNAPTLTTAPAAAPTVLKVVFSIAMLGATLSALGILSVPPTYAQSKPEIILQPVNSPISAQNIVIKRGKTTQNQIYDDFYYYNFTNFSQVDPDGSSSITPDPNCQNGATLKLVGHATASFQCVNKKFGLRYIVTIDGQPAVLSNVTSPDSNVTIASVGPNSFDVWEFAGVKTADLNINLAGGLPDGNHHLEVKVIGISLIDSRHNQNFYNAVYTSVDDLSLPPPDIPGLIVNENWYNCETDGTCFGLLSYDWSCRNTNVCSRSCDSDEQCSISTDGCNVCAPNETGQNVCQPPPACGDSCSTSNDCSKSTSGCTTCLPNDNGTGSVCAPPPACNVSCTRDGQCEGAKDGCTSCLPGDTGDSKVCRPPAACGVTCTRDDQCSGDTREGCTDCAPDGSGKNVCQIPYDPNMCKCDGFNALNLKNPSSSKFEFEAFAKVEGKATNVAVVKDMKFTLYKSSKSDPNKATPIASGTIVPEVVSQTGDKIRYRAVWSINPPAYDPNAIYRVGAEPTCQPKYGSSTSLIPTGKFYSSEGDQVMGVNYSSEKLVQNNNYLELDTLTDAYFTRIVEADSCKFIRFEYGAY